MITNLLIGTTAINRSDLHSEIFPFWVTLLSKIPDVKIVWFINIDVIDLLKYSYDETKENFKNLIPFETIFLPKKDPGFLNSCFLISREIHKYVIDNKVQKSSVCVLWLEDDWQLKGDNIIALNYVLKIVNELSYVNLSGLRKNYFWALAPSIISFSLFENLHVKSWSNAITKNVKGDPENLLGKYFLNNFDFKPEKYKTVNLLRNNFEVMNGEYMKYKNAKKYKLNDNTKRIRNFIQNDINFIRILPRFTNSFDAGRDYMKQKGIKKWERGDASCQYSPILDPNNNLDILLSNHRKKFSTTKNNINLGVKKTFKALMSRIKFYALNALKKIVKIIN
jgi:hypothetical protein